MRRSLILIITEFYLKNLNLYITDNSKGINASASLMIENKKASILPMKEISSYTAQIFGLLPALK